LRGKKLRKRKRRNRAGPEAGAQKKIDRKESSEAEGSKAEA
jgi:hypothetical protein